MTDCEWPRPPIATLTVVTVCVKAKVKSFRQWCEAARYEYYE